MTSRLLLIYSLPALVCCAQSTGGTSQSPLSLSNSPYVSFSHLPAPAQRYLFALGNRIQTAGKERTTLSGTFTNASGTSAPAQLIWQVPGQIWFRITGQQPLAYSATVGLQNASSMTSANANVLESLFDDTAESFLYGFMRGDGHRLIGLHYSTGAGTSANDVYVRSASAVAQPGEPLRSKFYLFDSQTKLLTRVIYQLANSTQVETDIIGWTSSNGQSFPAQIVRKENGSVVFTFTVTQATAGAAPDDSLFAGQ